MEDGLPKDAVLVGSRGGVVTGSMIEGIMKSIEIIGVDYPPLKVEDFTAGGPCACGTG